MTESDLPCNNSTTKEVQHETHPASEGLTTNTTTHAVRGLDARRGY